MISESAVATRHELIMSLVAGLSLIMKVWSRTPQLNNDLKSVPGMVRIFHYRIRILPSAVFVLPKVAQNPVFPKKDAKRSHRRRRFLI